MMDDRRRQIYAMLLGNPIAHEQPPDPMLPTETPETVIGRMFNVANPMQNARMRQYFMTMAQK